MIVAGDGSLILIMEESTGVLDGRDSATRFSENYPLLFVKVGIRADLNDKF